MLPRGQDTPNPTQQRETGTHLNPEGGYLQKFPTRGIGNLHTSTTGKYHEQTPGRRGYFSGGAKITEKKGGRTIGHDSGTVIDMAQICNQVKRPRKGTLGKTGEYNKVIVLVRTHTRGIGVYDYGTHT